MCEIGKLEMPVKMILDYVTDSRIIDLKSGKPLARTRSTNIFI